MKKMEIAKQPASGGGNVLNERERCALLVEARAERFERRKLFPLARALRMVAEEIREAFPPENRMA